jgi:CrcB protein
VVKLLVVGLGGFVGAVGRYSLSGIIQRLTPGFPLGTLIVNVLGSLVMGLLATLFLEKVMVSSELRVLLLIGVLGAFTTFSTFSWETFNLMRNGDWGFAILYAGGNLFGCLLAVWAGFNLAQRW